jgi:hypothetical protein
VLERGLASNPEARWPAMAALLDAISPVRRSSRRRLLVGVLGAALIIVGVVGAFAARHTSTDSLSRMCGGNQYRVSSGQQGTCNITSVTPMIFTMECKDTAGNRGALECAQGISSCETKGTGTCGLVN